MGYPHYMLRVADVAVRIHATAKEKGWWDKERGIPEQIALMHSELSEALEEWRIHGIDKLVYFKHTNSCIDKLKQDDMIPVCGHCGTKKPEGLAVELADCMIRIMDTLEHLEVDVEDVLSVKMKYNKTRPHRHGGKLA